MTMFDEFSVRVNRIDWNETLQDFGDDHCERYSWAGTAGANRLIVSITG